MVAALWAGERLRACKGGWVVAGEARVDYLGWCGARRREPAAAVNKALVAAGGVRGFARGAGGSGRVLVFRGVELDGPLPDSGYRSRTLRPASGAVEGEIPSDALEGVLKAFWDEGLVRDSLALDRAFLDLSGASGGLCVECGRLTRRKVRHVACEKGR